MLHFHKHDEFTKAVFVKAIFASVEMRKVFTELLRNNL